MAEPVRARRLSDEEGRRLLQIVRRGKHGSIRVRRAMIIMASASGTRVPAIARLVAADEDTVRDVIHTFNARGVAALDPRWAGGRPRLISDGDIEVIVAAERRAGLHAYQCVLGQLDRGAIRARPDLCHGQLGLPQSPRAGPQAAGLPALA
jgi:Winged helix-turn helix